MQKIKLIIALITILNTPFLGKTFSFFTENKGQYGYDTRFALKANSANFFFGSDQITYQLIQHDRNFTKNRTVENNKWGISDKTHIDNITVSFINSSFKCKITPQDILTTKFNYFNGKNSNEWITNVSNYQQLRYENIYDNIDFLYYSYSDQLKYDIIIKPGADINAIELKYGGVKNLKLTENGRLSIELSAGKISEFIPLAYQIINGKKTIINVSYSINKNGNIKFICNDYNKSSDLIIDPSLVFSTYVGGSDSETFNIDFTSNITTDSQGNVLEIGTTYSNNLPTTVGAYDITFGGGSIYSIDGYVFKLSADGKTMLFCTYVGGNNADFAHGIFNEPTTDDIYICGHTASGDFPTTSGAYQTVHNSPNTSAWDNFVMRFNSSANTLKFSTLVGCPSDDYAGGLVVDKNKNIFISGYGSSGYPVTPGAYDQSYNGSYDITVTKFDSTGSSILASTFLGGSSADRIAGAIALDTSGNVYLQALVTGNFPVTAGAFDQTYNGGSFDMAIVKFNSTLSTLVYSTYLGGTGDDYSRERRMHVDKAGQAYITMGATAGYPVTAGAYDQTYNGGTYDIAVTKLNSTGTGLIYSTFIGTSGNEIGTEIAVNDLGEVFLTGECEGNLPFTSDAADSSYNGNTDAFLMKIDAAGANLLHCSYFGGSNYERASSIALHGDYAYISGVTSSNNLPTGAGVFDNSYNGGTYDVFIASYYIPNSSVIGSVYNDINSDCTKGAFENGLTGRRLIINPGNIIVETNAYGSWSIDSLASGTYSIEADTSGKWRRTCPAIQYFSISNPDSTINAPAFGFVSTEPCASTDISITAPFLRRCFSNQKVYILAQNQETATGLLSNAYVEVELDPLLTVTSASATYSNLGNNKFKFNIGNLNPGQTADIWMNTTVSCNASLGKTLCMKAELLPIDSCVFDTLPEPAPAHIKPCINPAWDKSSLKVNGFCNGNDSIVFTVTNHGGSMVCYAEVRIFIDGKFVILDSIQLQGGAKKTYTFPGDGRTWRIEADQHPLHPGKSRPNATVESCGNSANWTPDLVNVLPPNDADPVVDIYCGVVTGSYDPNDKTGYPTGLGATHTILPNGKLEYLIRFQNTGTDTAFKIVVRDTLDTDLDIFSVVSGSSSHSYTFRMYGPRVLEWTFENIMLPDSNVNEAASHGFLTFSVNQNKSLANGTIINNDADIYFDFNAPIITNNTSHKIDDGIKSNFAVSMIGNTTVCPGDSTLLTAINAQAILWSTGSSNTSIYVKPVVPTSYTLTATPVGGSIPENIIVNVNVHTLPNPTLTVTGNTTFCQGEPTSLSSNFSAGNQWLYNGSPINGATGQTYTPTLSGFYTVKVTDQNTLCSATSSLASLTVKTSPIATANANKAAVCIGDTCILSVTGSGTYLWSNGETRSSFEVTPTTNTTYSVTVTGSNGCTATSTTSVNTNPLPSTPTILQNGNLLASSSPTNNQWNLNGTPIGGATGQFYTPSQSGFYSVTVSNGFGCKSTSSLISITSINELMILKDITIYPNPNKGSFEVSFSAPNADNITIALVNSLGQIIYQHETKLAQGKNTIEISSKPPTPGIYFLKFQSEKSNQTYGVTIN